MYALYCKIKHKTDITEILLKVALNTINLNPIQYFLFLICEKKNICLRCSLWKGIFCGKNLTFQHKNSLFTILIDLRLGKTTNMFVVSDET